MKTKSAKVSAIDATPGVRTLDPEDVAASPVLLLVEPSVSQRYLMRALFESRGYRVVSAKTAAEADSRVRTEGPCVALVSWELPDASVFSMLRSWRRDPTAAGCSAFMMDAQRDPKRAYRARSAGAVDLIPRPISAASIDAFFERTGRGWATSERVGGKEVHPGPPRMIVPRLDRRILVQRLRTEIADAKSLGKPLSLGLVSLENLTDIKIEHGRAFAEKIMADVEFRLWTKLRACDLVARHTGSEFALLLPYTDHAGAVTALERVRECVETRSNNSGAIKFRLGTTMGVATEQTGAASPIDLIRASVAALGADRASSESRYL